LAIEWLRKQTFSGSDLVIEQKLDAAWNSSRYIASYKSEGLKIFGLLTIPNGEQPKTGWPVVIFNHGYIPPAQYRTTEKYVPYQGAFAAAGYITFKSDYRGHGSSEGRATGGYGNVDYTIDVLNALASVKRMKEADPNRIGLWGHSMGGSVTLRAMVTTKDIKAGVIWAGVVASYPDLLTRWRATPNASTPTGGGAPGGVRGWGASLIAQYGTFEQNPAFWNSISPNSYLKDLSGPIQLHHGTADTSVPVEFSQTLDKQLKAAGQYDELYIYPGAEHNITAYLEIALQRSVAFFDKYVKMANSK
jgi:dipeptidyl aminopeptidase/acylaminoacyl peptidase